MSRDRRATRHKAVTPRELLAVTRKIPIFAGLPKGKFGFFLGFLCFFLVFGGFFGLFFVCFWAFLGFFLCVFCVF
jgi:hypothetical protein